MSEMRWTNRIAVRMAVLSSLLIIITLGLYVIINIPYQRKTVVEAMESEAAQHRHLSGSGNGNGDHNGRLRVGGGAPHEGRYGEHVYCLRGHHPDGRGSPGSAPKTAGSRKRCGTSGIPPDGGVAGYGFLKEFPGHRRGLFHYSYPFKYSGIDWGWIQQSGLSLKKYNAGMVSLYMRTFFYVC
ncbi:MAG: hypothetical protein MZV70_16755 [Desulfobacterales bacterium]|nr:hypothetical protein [Desulfobacterales bacterium]